VLVVDDNPINRRVLQEQLLSWGMGVGLAGSGPEGLAELQRAQGAGSPYHLALLDYLMPGMDGMALARAIKARAELRQVVLVMLSSLTQGGEAALLEEAGFASFLVKPVYPSQLQDLLAALWATRAGKASQERIRPAAKRPVRQFAARVLVAEDNITNQQVARLALERFGCRVEVAANGREAVQVAASLPFDLVFMDCEMPELDGLEATAALRRAGRQLPIVAMTARAMQGDRERCLEAGMDDYLSKPLVLEELEAALERWVPPGPELPPALDPQALGRLRDLAGDPARLGQLLGAYARQGRELVAQLHQTLEARTAQALGRAAHTLKGASLNVGANPLAGLCARLEELGRAGDLAGAGDLVAQVQTEWERVSAALDAEENR
jgi:CheY-like chemotaxis protein/HPt (histidine-containing phosphotransfer) domain-containing protein